MITRYAFPATDQDFVQGGAPNPNPTGAASANDAAQNFPHRVHSDRLLTPRIALRHEPAAITDPTQAVLASIDDSLSRQVAPWIVPPPDAEPFHQASGIVIPAQDGNFHTVVTVPVPIGRNGVLILIANEFVSAGFQDFAGNIIYQIVRNRPAGNAAAAAERNFENIQASLGTPQQPGKLAAGIRLFENDVIELMVKNVNVAPAGEIIGGLLGGWFYPRTYDDGY